MDRNDAVQIIIVVVHASLSARRVWIEIDFTGSAWVSEFPVALRKESVDRNPPIELSHARGAVALRKESVDRNSCPSPC